jgi:hypothetical protein
MDYLAKIHNIKKEISHYIGKENKAKKEHAFTPSREKSEKSEKSRSAHDMVIEPASNLTPMYWQSGNRVLGPAAVSFLAKHQGQFFLCLEWQKSFLWIHESLLRSKRDFEQQGQTICNCCGGSEFWKSEFVEAICRRCSPPVSDARGGQYES